MSAVSRNDSCPCGSGKKYKQCCGALDKAQVARYSLNPSISEFIKTEAGHRQTGHLWSQESIYRRVLRVSPNQPEALSSLGSGVVAPQENKIIAEPIGKAIHTRPSSATYYNLGIELKAQRKLDAAVENYHRALALKPNFVEAHINLGAVLRDRVNWTQQSKAYSKLFA